MAKTEIKFHPGVTLHFRPRKTWTIGEFLRKADPYTIALDGAVKYTTCRAFSEEQLRNLAEDVIAAQGQKIMRLTKAMNHENNGNRREIFKLIKIEEEKTEALLPLLDTNIPLKLPLMNINHHDGDDRLKTRSTTGQALLEANIKLFSTFQKDGKPFAILLNNDCDPDTTMASWLLKTGGMRFNPKVEDAIQRLAFHTDMIDTTAGVYIFNLKEKIARELNWISEPYKIARMNGTLPHLNADEMRELMEKMFDRITAHVLGKGDATAMNYRYNPIFDGRKYGQNWKIVEELGINCKTKLYQEEYDMMIAVREYPNSNKIYSVLKLTSAMPADLEEFCAQINKIEGFEGVESRGWGGGDYIIGSDRLEGSATPPEKLAEYMKNFLETGWIDEKLMS